MVVMDREDYFRKAEELLSQPTYKSIPTDPTTKCNNKLVSLLMTIKTEGEINEIIYRRLYPTRGRFSQVHKKGMPLRPIVSSRGVVNCPES